MTQVHRSIGAMVLALLAVTMFAPSYAQQNEEAAIRAQVERLVDRLNARDSQGVAMLYEADADRRDGGGKWARGRGEVLSMYDSLIRELPSGVTARFDYTVRLVRTDLALVDGDWISSRGTKGPFTMLASKKSGVWLFAAGRQGAAFP